MFLFSYFRVVLFRKRFIVLFCKYNCIFLYFIIALLFTKYGTCFIDF